MATTWKLSVNSKCFVMKYFSRNVAVGPRWLLPECYPVLHTVLLAQALAFYWLRKKKIELAFYGVRYIHQACLENNLQWFLVKDGIDHKILSLVYICFSGTASWYLQELIPCCEPPRSLIIFSVSPLYSRGGWKPYQKVFRLQGFLQLCPQTLECPPPGAERILSLQLFAGNSRLIFVFHCFS